jgi:hypothetical protein
VALLVLGILLALDLPAKFGVPFSATEWGYTFFSLGADVAVVYLIIDRLLLRDERERWKAVEGKAIELVRDELSTVLSYVQGLLLPRMDERDPREMRLSRMKEVAEQQFMDLKKSVSPEIAELASLLREESGRLGDLQVRYSSRLKPELIDLMIDVETSLESIGSDLSFAKEYSKNDAMRDVALLRLQQLIKRLVNAVDDGTISMMDISSLYAREDNK